MPLYWLCYHHNNQISVVIEPGASCIHARMRAALANLDEGEFTEGHELDRKTAKQVPKAMIGRRRKRRGCWLSLNEETNPKDCPESPLVGTTATMWSRRIQF
jgi:hypothetical protein